jgi:GrpB-like predicted nucleotidyltransferase (UPF0157 family)
MPPPLAVELQPYTPNWAQAAARESERLAQAFGENLIVVHHIGSTAIRGIAAKPILDLMPVVRDLSLLDRCRRGIEDLGYEWWGEYGIPGRRFCTFTEAATGRRRVHLHCFQEGASEVERHLAFRDYLNAHPDVARSYDLLKARCRDLHPLNSHAYADCKSEWIQGIESQALAFYRATQDR